MSDPNDPKEFPETPGNPNTPSGESPVPQETPQPEPAAASPDSSWSEEPAAAMSEARTTPPPAPVAGAGLTNNQWLLILHLSQLANVVLPLAGIAAPIIIWQIKKDEVAGMDLHGKMITNFCILMVAISVVGTILTVATCGVLGVVTVPVGLGIWLAWMVFAVIGGIKANDGVFWKYPGTFEFIK